MGRRGSLWWVAAVAVAVSAALAMWPGPPSGSADDAPTPGAVETTGSAAAEGSAGAAAEGSAGAAVEVAAWAAAEGVRSSAVDGTRVAVVGDTGTGDAAERATAQRIAADGVAEAFDALVIVGDLVYEDGDAAQVPTVVTEPFGPVLDQGTVLLPVLGNHDYRTGEQDEILAALGRSRSWYVERVGDLRVVVLDSMRVDDPAQTRWLRDVLAAPVPDGTWTVVALHHPPYSAGEHGSDRAVRARWAPVFAASDVPLVLSGHDHDYQRSTPQDGVTYVVTGAGARTRAAGRAGFTAVSESVLHYVDLRVEGDRLRVRAVDQSGGIVDSFALTR